jgi:hypothetical protein
MKFSDNSLLSADVGIGHLDLAFTVKICGQLDFALIAKPDILILFLSQDNST